MWLGVLMDDCSIATGSGSFKVFFGEGGALPYLFAFLKQIYSRVQIPSTSPFWEEHRLGTDCDLTIPRAQPIIFRRSMLQSQCTIAVDVQNLGCKDWFGNSVIKVCA